MKFKFLVSAAFNYMIYHIFFCFSRKKCLGSGRILRSVGCLIVCNLMRTLCSWSSKVNHIISTLAKVTTANSKVIKRKMDKWHMIIICNFHYDRYLWCSVSEEVTVKHFNFAGTNFANWRLLPYLQVLNFTNVEALLLYCQCKISEIKSLVKLSGFTVLLVNKLRFIISLPFVCLKSFYKVGIFLSPLLLL